jgi:hypothetical protein
VKQITEHSVLLSPINPNLKTSEQCAYKEGRRCHKDGLNPIKALDIGVDLVKKTGKPVCDSIEAMYYLTQGIMGEKCEIQTDGLAGRDYCKELCKIECENRIDEQI